MRDSDYEKRRREQMAALEAACESWKDEDHPELEQGAAVHVARMRQEGDRRFTELVQRNDQS